jgi:hypothetical protein
MIGKQRAREGFQILDMTTLVSAKNDIGDEHHVVRGTRLRYDEGFGDSESAAVMLKKKSFGYLALSPGERACRRNAVGCRLIKFNLPHVDLTGWKNHFPVALMHI